MGNAENPSKVLASSISIERDEEDKDDQEPSLLPSTISSAKKINYRTACHIDCNKDETNFRAALCFVFIFSIFSAAAGAK